MEVLNTQYNNLSNYVSHLCSPAQAFGSVGLALAAIVLVGNLMNNRYRVGAVSAITQVLAVAVVTFVLGWLCTRLTSNQAWAVVIAILVLGGVGLYYLFKDDDVIDLNLFADRISSVSPIRF